MVSTGAFKPLKEDPRSQVFSAAIDETRILTIKATLESEQLTVVGNLIKVNWSNEENSVHRVLCSMAYIN